MSKPPSRDTTQVELAALRRRIDDLERQLRQVPSRFPVPDPTPPEVSSLRETITQAAHGLVAGNVVYNNAGTWTKAQANSDTGAGRYTGVIESVTTDTFVIVYSGTITISLTAGTTYYLSDATAGLLIARASIGSNALIVPVCRAISSTVAIVMSAHDQSGDLQKVVVGDKTDGGGSIRVNHSASEGVSIGAGIDVDAGDVTVSGGVVRASQDGASFQAKLTDDTLMADLGGDPTWGGYLYLYDQAGVLHTYFYIDASGFTQLVSTGEVLIGGDGVRLQTTVGGTMGFFSSSGTTKPTVTGSRGGNAALASLLTALHDLGLLTNSSS